MKNFILNLGNNIDRASSLKEKMLNAMSKYPFFKWHGIDTDEDRRYSVAYAGTGDYLTFGLNNEAYFAAINKRYFKPETPNVMFSKNRFVRYDEKPYIYSQDNFYTALSNIAAHAKAVNDYLEDPGYDYKINGVPVRVYSSFIQIGSQIIPFKNYSPYLFKLKEEERMDIFKIVIKMNTEFDF